MSKQHSQQVRDKALELDWIDPKKLDADPENPRLISQEQLSDLKESILQYGFIEPVIYNKKTKQIVGGHQRIKAAIQEGIKLVPVIQVDWSKKKQKAANLALNKISGDWDYSRLKEYIESIDLEVKDPNDLDSYITGFTDEDLKEIDLEIDKTLEAKEDDFDADEAIGAIKTPTTKPGDLFLIDGKHRLLCGDSTNYEEVLKLINEKPIDCIFTDPPYGINIVSKDGSVGGGSRTYRAVENDNSTEVAQLAFNLTQQLDVPTHIWWGANHYASDIRVPSSTCWIVWDKQGGKHTTFADCELAWTNIKSPVRMFQHIWDGFRRDSERGEDRVHPTQKPVKLLADILEFFKLEGIILDLFLGSGSTLIACEQINRTCYGIEIDPIYCDVIIERYKKLKPDAEIKKI